MNSEMNYHGHKRDELPRPQSQYNVRMMGNIGFHLAELSKIKCLSLSYKSGPAFPRKPTAGLAVGPFIILQIHFSVLFTKRHHERPKTSLKSKTFCFTWPDLCLQREQETLPHCMWISEDCISSSPCAPSSINYLAHILHFPPEKVKTNHRSSGENHHLPACSRTEAHPPLNYLRMMIRILYFLEILHGKTNLICSWTNKLISSTTTLSAHMTKIHSVYATTLAIPMIFKFTMEV